MKILRSDLPLLLMIILSVFLGCSSSIVSIQDSYKQILPQKPLEFAEPTQDNLQIKISNIADKGSSYKNRIELYINQKKIQANWIPSNLDRSNVFTMRLKPGYYDVKAVYFAFVGWNEEKYAITGSELIAILPDQRTLLSCPLVKKSDGTPVIKNPRFDITYEALTATGENEKPAPAILKPINAQTRTRTQKADTTVRDVRTEKKSESPLPQGQNKNLIVTDFVGKGITLQINTVPENARIIIDEKYVGQAPLRIKVDSATNHVIQISNEGYQSAIKYIDCSSLKGDVYHLLIELQE